MPKLTKQAEYKIIVRDIAYRGACQPGVRFIRKFETFEEMFYSIRRYDWLNWLYQKYGLGSVRYIHEEENRNAMSVQIQSCVEYLGRAMGDRELVDRLMNSPFVIWEQDLPKELRDYDSAYTTQQHRARNALKHYLLGYMDDMLNYLPVQRGQEPRMAEIMRNFDHRVLERAILRYVSLCC